MNPGKADLPPRSARHARGFTLIEVLAALVIVALGMLGVIEAVTQSARNGAYLREKTLAHWIALNVITEKRLQQEAPPVAESSADVEFAGQRWRWSMQVTQTQVTSLRRMDVSVRPADAPDSSALATVTGFYGTAIGAAGGSRLNWSGAGKPGGAGEDEGGDESDDGDNAGKPATPGAPGESGQPGSPPPAPTPDPPPGGQVEEE
jgi:general secretion pathway protein I